MIYNSIEKIKTDFNWIVNESTLEEFISCKLTSFYEELLLNKLSDNTNDKFVLSFYDELFEKLNLQNTKWQKNINNNMLPTLALIPEVGIRVIIQIDIDNTYLIIGKDGSEKIATFHKGTKFKELKLNTKKEQAKTAIAMFKEIAFEQKKYLFYALIASISINILSLGSSFYSMQVYDRVIPTNATATLISLTIGVVIAIFLEMILKLSRAAILDQAAKNMDIQYSHNIFERYLSIRIDNLPKSIGTVSGQLQSYVSVRSFVSTASVLLLIDLPFAFLFLGVVVLIAGINIAIVMVIFLLLSILIGLLFKNKIQVLTKSSSQASHKKLGLLVESIENSQKVKATGAKWSLMHKWNKLSEDNINDELKIKHFTDISNFLSAFFQQISYVAVVATGAYMLSQTSDITMGSLIAISILSNKVFMPIGQLPSLFVQWGKAKITIEDLNNIYKLEQDNHDISRPITHKLKISNLRCHNIKFAYEEDNNIIDIEKLEIKQGEKVAILGVIGSGKSTILKLLSGLYKPTSGKVFLDNIDMQQISRNNISQNVAYLAQETKLFSGTLRDNLSIGLTNINDENILAACTKTGLINLISSLPKGLDTIVPEGGDTVSGGQKQLIALTRMLVAPSPILLLDEPTASMDDGTENHIINVLHQNVKKDQTMVIVTHKQSLLNIVDRIIILTPQGIAIDGPKDLVIQHLQQNELNKNKDK